MTRVFIVSTGSVTGAGTTVEQQWKNLQRGGGNFVTMADALKWLPFTLDGLNEKIGGATVCPVRITNAELAELVEEKPQGFDRHQLFGLVAAEEAMRDISGYDPQRFACIGATGGAGLIDIFQSTTKLREGKRLGPRDNLKYLPNLFVGYLTRRHGLKGQSEVHGTACAASMHAVMSLMRMIRCGDVDGGLVVGTDAAISEFGIASFQGQRALGNGHVYQTDRSGFVMGEGAGACFIASEAACHEHDWEPLVEITGYGASSDASSEGAITDPNPEGAAFSMRTALEKSGWGLGVMDLIKAHGTATGAGDLSELKALQLVDRDGAKIVPVMSLKSYMGHLLGAAGIAELVLVIEMMRHNTILPTRLLRPDNLDENCAIVQHVMEMTTVEDFRRSLLNGFGFGGTNATLILEKL